MHFQKFLFAEKGSLGGVLSFVSHCVKVDCDGQMYELVNSSIGFSLEQDQLPRMAGLQDHRILGRGLVKII